MLEISDGTRPYFNERLMTAIQVAISFKKPDGRSSQPLAFFLCSFLKSLWTFKALIGLNRKVLYVFGYTRCGFAQTKSLSNKAFDFIFYFTFVKNEQKLFAMVIRFVVISLLIKKDFAHPIFSFIGKIDFIVLQNLSGLFEDFCNCVL